MLFLLILAVQNPGYHEEQHISYQYTKPDPAGWLHQGRRIRSKECGHAYTAYCQFLCFRK
jgi:hypothetical protein